MNSHPRKLALAAGLIAALALPASAAARGGNPDVPPVDSGSGAACATIASMNSGVVDKPASHKPISVDFQVTNCSATRALTLSTTVVPTAYTVRSLDPFEEAACTGATVSAQTLTLKPRESRPVSVAGQFPYCGYSPWGVTLQYDVAHEATLRNVADGSVLSTATGWVAHRGGV
jgi:hypothetical protein